MLLGLYPYANVGPSDLADVHLGERDSHVDMFDDMTPTSDEGVDEGVEYNDTVTVQT